MTKFLTRNLGWKLFSLGAAVLIWILVASEPELSTFASVRVQYKDLPDDLEINSEVVETVLLELRGPSGELASFADSGRVSHAAVILDMSNAKPGERTFTISPANVKLPRGIHLERAVPAQIRFELEPRTFRTVPVNVRFSGQPPAGYELAGYKAEPAALAIVGPESRVARVRSVKTDPIDLEGVVGNPSFRVNAFVDDPHIRFQGPAQIAVQVTMRKKT